MAYLDSSNVADLVADIKVISTGTSTPLVDSENGSVGTSDKFAKEDHSHPLTTNVKEMTSTVFISDISDLKRNSLLFQLANNITLDNTGITVEAYSRGIIVSDNAGTGALLGVGYNGKIYSAFFTNYTYVYAKVTDPVVLQNNINTKVSGYGALSTLDHSALENTGWTCPNDGLVYIICGLDTSGSDAYLYVMDLATQSYVANISTTDANGLTLSTCFPVLKNHAYKINAIASISSYNAFYQPFTFQ